MRNIGIFYLKVNYNSTIHCTRMTISSYCNEKVLTRRTGGRAVTVLSWEDSFLDLNVCLCTKIPIHMLLEQPLMAIFLLYFRWGSRVYCWISSVLKYLHACFVFYGMFMMHVMCDGNEISYHFHTGTKYHLNMCWYISPVISPKGHLNNSNPHWKEPMNIDK